LQSFHPQLVYVDEHNRIVEKRDEIAVRVL